MNEILTQAIVRIDQNKDIRVSDFYFDSERTKWVLKFTIISTKPLEGLYETSWHCFIDKEYPFGSIYIFPSAKGGITGTYPHQNRNKKKADLKWRTGKICLDQSFDQIAPRFALNDFQGDPKRLDWHLKRAHEWVEAAAEDTLIRAGQVYELPDFDISDNGTTVAFISSEIDLKIMSESHIGNFGICELYYQGSYNFPIAMGFYDQKWRDVFIVDEQIKKKGSTKGVWIFLDKAPLLHTFYTPANFTELDYCMGQFGISLPNVFKFIVDQKKKKEDIHYIAFGFPISKSKGSDPEAIHWQFMRLPNFHLEPKGFRNKNETVAKYNLQRFKDQKLPLKWIRSRNINPENIFSRVPEYSFLSKYRYVIIGLGSLGGVFAESLLKSGGVRLTLIDSDFLNEGNISRHILGMESIGVNKAQAVASKLRLVNPYANIDVIPTSFNSDIDLQLDEDTIVFDFSSEDSVPFEFEKYSKPKNGFYFNFSFGLFASPIYCYRSISKNFSFKKFKDTLGPYLEPIPNSFELPQEGIGCWNPVFPSNFFSVQAASHICFQFFMFAVKKNDDQLISVYRVELGENNIFEGIIKVV